jgi:hypothetical protein
MGLLNWERLSDKMMGGKRHDRAERLFSPQLGE